MKDIDNIKILCIALLIYIVGYSGVFIGNNIYGNGNDLLYECGALGLINDSECSDKNIITINILIFGAGYLLIFIFYHLFKDNCCLKGGLDE